MTPIPSRPGDVLIVVSGSQQTLAVGRVTIIGQRELVGDPDVRTFKQHQATLARVEADRALMTPAHAVYLVDHEQDLWTCLTR